MEMSKLVRQVAVKILWLETNDGCPNSYFRFKALGAGFLGQLAFRVVNKVDRFHNSDWLLNIVWNNTIRNFAVYSFTEYRQVPGIVLLALLVLGIPILAQTTEYRYDADGRLIEVDETDGSITQYVYDATGNILQVKNSNSPLFSVVSLAPTVGTVGTTVTISGTGFSSPTVSFNGTPAASVTVNTARTTLTTVVPVGATTGPVTVKVDTVSRAAGTFTVVNLNGRPTLGAYSLPIAQPGDSITLAGTNFDPTATANTVKVGDVLAQVTAVSDTAITFVVPNISIPINPQGTAGTAKFVTVQTAQGTTTAPKSLYLVPRIAFKESLSATAIQGTLSSYGDNGLILVEGGKTINLTVNATRVNGNGFLRLFVYGPDNALVTTLSSINFNQLTNGTLQIVSTLNLPASGQYVLQPVFDFGTGFQATGVLGVGVAPVLGAFSAPVAQPGDTITLAGSGFENGGLTVKVGESVANVTSVTSSGVTFVVPNLSVPYNPVGTPGTATLVTVETVLGITRAPNSLYLVPRIPFRKPVSLESDGSGKLIAYGDNGLFLVGPISQDMMLSINVTSLTGSGYLRVFIFRPDGSLQQKITVPSVAFSAMSNGSFQAVSGPIDLTGVQGQRYFFQVVFDYNINPEHRATGTVALGLDLAPNNIQTALSLYNTSSPELRYGANTAIGIFNPATKISVEQKVQSALSIFNSFSSFNPGDEVKVNAGASVLNPASTSIPTGVDAVVSVLNPTAELGKDRGFNEGVSLYNPLSLFSSGSAMGIDTALSILNRMSFTSTGINAALSLHNPQTNSALSLGVNSAVSIHNSQEFFSSTLGVNGAISIYNSRELTSSAVGINTVVSILNPLLVSGTVRGSNAAVSSCNPGSSSTCSQP